jgi:hypothetical protein
MKVQGCEGLGRRPSAHLAFRFLRPLLSFQLARIQGGPRRPLKCFRLGGKQESSVLAKISKMDTTHKLHDC